MKMLSVRSGLSEKIGDRIDQMLWVELEGGALLSQLNDCFPVAGERGDHGCLDPLPIQLLCDKDSVKVRGGKQRSYFSDFVTIQAAHLLSLHHAESVRIE